MVANSFGYYENIEDPSRMYQKEFYELKCNLDIEKKLIFQNNCKINKGYANIGKILNSNNLTSV